MSDITKEIQDCVDSIINRFEQTTLGMIGGQGRYGDSNQVRGVTVGKFKEIADEKITTLLLRLFEEIKKK